MGDIKAIKPYSVIKNVHSETRSFTALNYFSKASSEKSFSTEKFFAHEGGDIVVLIAQEKGDIKNTSKVLFYSIDSNETYYEPIDINSNVQCIEFLDKLYAYTPDIQSMDPELLAKQYSLLMGCRNGDLYYVQFMNTTPFQISAIKIHNFVRTSNQGNAELSSIKKIKVFAPKNSAKK
jgi:3-dehydroquinate synthase class II